jgi:hypothetical protein
MTWLEYDRRNIQPESAEDSDGKDAKAIPKSIATERFIISLWNIGCCFSATEQHVLLPPRLKKAV